MAHLPRGADPVPHRVRHRAPLGLQLTYVLTLGLASCGEVAVDDRRARPSLEFSAVRPALPAELGPDLAALVDEHVRRADLARSSAEAHGTLGLVYEANRLWPEALACFEQAAELDADDPVWAAHRAKMLQRMGRADQALDVLADAARRFERSAPIQHRFGDALFEAGDFEGARRAFQRTIRLDRKRAEGFLGLGEVQLVLGDPERAVANLERAVRKAPDEQRAHYILGLAYREVGRLHEAELELLRGLGGSKSFLPDRGTRRLPEFVRGFERLLERGIRLTDSSPAEAIDVLGECLDRQPENPIVLVNLAVALQRLERHEHALEILGRAVAASPDVPMVRVNLAACLLALERPDEALAAADHAVQLAPGFAHAHTLRGRSLLVLGQSMDAHAALLLSSSLDPNDASVAEQLGELCLELDHGPEAVEHYARLCQLMHDSWEAHAQLVRAAVLAKDLRQARTALVRARELAPAEPMLAEMELALASLEASQD